ncbi:hypothetical protein ACTVT6_13590, partial [Staphylococcus aureus]|uniref:hypothetical protein n=1 Tax=Staphylococcus aureus TaxID=1280 RepID=UPI003FA75297
MAQKTNPSPIDSFSVQDESDMVLMGYLAFLDPPKESTAKAIKALNKYGVSAGSPTCSQTERVTLSLSPVNIFTDT